MKTLIPVLLLFVLCACNERRERVDYANPDSTAHSYHATPKKLDYTPQLAAPKPPIDINQLPDPYQHKAQTFHDGSTSPSWDYAGFPDANKFISFFKQFQLMVRTDDAKGIARRSEERRVGKEC